MPALQVVVVFFVGGFHAVGPFDGGGLHVGEDLLGFLEAVLGDEDERVLEGGAVGDGRKPGGKGADAADEGGDAGFGEEGVDDVGLGGIGDGAEEDGFGVRGGQGEGRGARDGRGGREGAVEEGLSAVGAAGDAGEVFGLAVGAVGQSRASAGESGSRQGAAFLVGMEVRGLSRRGEGAFRELSRRCEGVFRELAVKGLGGRGQGAVRGC